MNLYIIIPAGISILMFIPLLVQSVSYYFKHKIFPTFVYSIFIFVSIIGMALFGMNGFLVEGQWLLAELSLGGSLVVLIIAEIILATYIQLIYGKFKYLTILFLIVSVATFTSILYHPWEIEYADGLHIQPISNLLIFLVFILSILIFLMFIISVIKIREKSNAILQRLKNHENPELVTIKRLKKQFATKLRNGWLIAGLYGLCLITSSLGMLPGFFYVDIYGIMFSFILVTFLIVRNPDTLNANPMQIYGSFIISGGGINLVEYTPWITLDSSIVSGGVSAFRDFISKICEFKSPDGKSTEILQFNQLQVIVLSQILEKTVIRMFTFVKQSNFMLTYHLKKILSQFISEYKDKLVKTDSALPVFTEFGKKLKIELEIYEN